MDGEPPPLTGLLVADFSRILAGPLATMFLGDLGADVVKIERPGVGDVTRAWGPPFTEDGDSAYYLAVNRNKRSLVLDLDDPADAETAQQLALSADVVVENFSAGTMDRLGLGYDSLAEHNPRIVFCRISGFGGAGGRDLPGYDFLVQAVGGLMSITGDPDGPPMKTGVAVVDVLTGLHATIGILAALTEREHSGRGQLVEVNLMSSALASLVNQASSYLTAGVIPGRMGNRHPSITPYETFDTASGTIAIATGNDAQFRSLLEAIGRLELADDPRLATNARRVSEREALAAAIGEALSKRTAAEWMTDLQTRGVPCGPINTINEAFALADTLGLDPIRTLETGSGSTVSTVANPIDLHRTPVRYRLAPPSLGEGGDATNRPSRRDVDDNRA